MPPKKLISPVAIFAIDVPPNTVKSNLPEEFASRFEGREKRRIGDLFGLTNFGVNVVRLLPGSISSLQHCHETQDEFIYVLEGSPTLVAGGESIRLQPGMCAGFKAGAGIAHHLLNNTDEDVWYLEIGDRSPGDKVTYPNDDLKGVFIDGIWRFTRKDGREFS
jgi:uncharacterized cupin superfamily protein